MNRLLVNLVCQRPCLLTTRFFEIVGTTSEWVFTTVPRYYSDKTSGTSFPFIFSTKRTVENDNIYKKHLVKKMVWRLASRRWQEIFWIFFKNRRGCVDRTRRDSDTEPLLLIIYFILSLFTAAGSSNTYYQHHLTNTLPFHHEVLPSSYYRRHRCVLRRY